jgi:superfamily II DNA or RNA helicase
MELRPYQEEGIQALVDGWDNGGQRLAVVVPTGAGKTVMFAHLIYRMRRERGIARTLVIAHREELLEQAADKIRRIAPHLKIGIVKGSRNEHKDAHVVIASIQTLAWRAPCVNPKVDQYGRKAGRCGQCTRCSTLPRAKQISGIGMVVVDEAHHAGSPSYRSVLRYYGGYDGVPVAGFTATMTRVKGGLADVWEDVVYTREISEMINDGYLVKPHGKQVVIEGMDLGKAKKQGGDFTEKSLAELMLDSDAMSDIAKAYVEYASDRPGIVFSPTVEVAQEMTDAFNGVGIPTVTVWGAMASDLRKKALADFKSGSVQVLSNVMVLTEGFDEPKASCLVVARPTMNPGLYVQMAGRVLRLSPETGKTDALILDVTGVASRHKLVSIVDLTGKDKKNKVTLDHDGAEEEEETPEPEVLTGVGQEVNKELLQVGGWRDIDLMASPTRWVRSPMGYRFAAVNRRAYFTVPSLQHDMYHLRVIIDGVAQTPPGDPAAPLKRAMQEIDRIALVQGGDWDNKGAPWRYRRASEKQVTFAKRLGISVPEGAKGGDVSDAIDAYKIGKFVDATVTRHEKKLKEIRGE